MAGKRFYCKSGSSFSSAALFVKNQTRKIKNPVLLLAVKRDFCNEIMEFFSRIEKPFRALSMVLFMDRQHAHAAQSLAALVIGSALPRRKSFCFLNFRNALQSPFRDYSPILEGFIT